MFGIVGMAYFLSKESSEQAFDPKKNTLEKLKALLEDLYLEYVCGYVFYYYSIKEAQTSGVSPAMIQEQIEKLRKNVKEYTSSRDGIVCKRAGIDPFILKDYISHYIKDA